MVPQVQALRTVEAKDAPLGHPEGPSLASRDLLVDHTAVFGDGHDAVRAAFDLNRVTHGERLGKRLVYNAAGSSFFRRRHARPNEQA
jgi:hypothetical protein